MTLQWMQDLTSIKKLTPEITPTSMIPLTSIITPATECRDDRSPLELNQEVGLPKRELPMTPKDLWAVPRGLSVVPRDLSAVPRDQSAVPRDLSAVPSGHKTVQSSLFKWIQIAAKRWQRLPEKRKNRWKRWNVIFALIWIIYISLFLYTG